jgi:hypothetical protein
MGSTRNNLPDTEFIKILTEKASARKDIRFDFIGKLRDFRERVSAEIGYINRLFPEYTPHDENYHIKNLFNVADKLLGIERYENMNAAELFALAVSLYGHDWGMAISTAEESYYKTGQIINGHTKDDICVLIDEENKIAGFAKDNGIKLTENGFFGEISTELFREYIRQTHAYRSGEKVRRFFKIIDGGVADACDRICYGHWLEFEKLEDHENFPLNFSLLGETANIRALAIYLRLIDLLDLAEDRTPYVIWKFVAPRDPKSKMAWDKHRALRPVTCPEYLKGRIIQVDGSTDNNEVYAALNDFAVWCDNQLRCSKDILSRMQDSRHQLDISHIDWRIAPRGFRPISVQFEFNRERMFEILGDEIYQGDPYIFLRELLQNCIDAIQMRREIIRKYAKVDPGDFGVIYVNAKHGENGDIEVTFTDNGIGMDEYIIRNYLAIAGMSYYRSDEFIREDLNIDPISRFGVGILSCFMVSNKIEIITYKDRNLSPPANPLRITIPDMQRQFRIEELPPEGFVPGTKITVFVEGNKLPNKDKTDRVRKLEITTYLKEIAGFVEFPIIITEDNKKTIILHPYHDVNEAIDRFGSDYEIHKFELSYDWQNVFYPQDLRKAREIMLEEYLDINSDLQLEGFEGIISYPTIIDKYENVRWADKETGFFIEEPEGSRTLIRWQRYYSFPYSNAGIAKSSSRSHLEWLHIFKNGILIPNASNPPHMRLIELRNELPPAKTIVNLKKITSINTTLSRSELRNGARHWFEEINNARLKYYINNQIKNKIKSSMPKRIREFGNMILNLRINYDDFKGIITSDNIPLLFMGKGGIINTRPYKEISNEKIYVIHDIRYKSKMIEILNSYLLNEDICSNYIEKWAGEDILLIDIDTQNIYHDSMFKYISKMFNDEFVTINIEFIKPPSNNIPPILQYVKCSKKIIEEMDKDELLKKEAEDPSALTTIERFTLRSIFPYDLSLAPAIKFPNQYRKYFSYGTEVLNIYNPIVIKLLQTRANIHISSLKNTLNAENLGLLVDLMKNLDLRSRFCNLKFPNFVANINEFWKLTKELKLAEIDNIDDYVPSKDDIIPGTILHESNASYLGFLKMAESDVGINFFGTPI